MNKIGIASIVITKTLETERSFEGWGSVEVKDKEGEIIPVDKIAEIMDTFIARGGTLMDSHSNRHVGKIIDWELRQKNGSPGIWLKGYIFKNYPIDNEVWQSIKSGEYQGFSLGGETSTRPEYKCDDSTGVCADVLTDIFVYEMSVVRSPANQEASIEVVNLVAKSDDLAKNMPYGECISKMKSQGYSEEQQHSICNKMVEEGKVSPCSKAIEDNKQLFINYAKKKGIHRLDAYSLLDKCNLCKEFVDKHRSKGFTRSEALYYLQKELDRVLKMSKELIEESTVVPEGLTEIVKANTEGITKLTESVAGMMEMLKSMNKPKVKAEDKKEEEDEEDEDKDKDKDKEKSSEDKPPIPVIPTPDETLAKMKEDLKAEVIKELGLKDVKTPKPNQDVTHPSEVKKDGAKTHIKKFYNKSYVVAKAGEKPNKTIEEIMNEVERDRLDYEEEHGVIMFR